MENLIKQHEELKVKMLTHVKEFEEILEKSTDIPECEGVMSLLKHNIESMTKICQQFGFYSKMMKWLLHVEDVMDTSVPKFNEDEEI